MRKNRWPIDPWADTVCAVEAHIEVMTPQEGARPVQPIFVGYRNSCAYFDDLGAANCLVFFNAVDGETLSAGESGVVQMDILGPAMMEEKLHPGSTFHMDVGLDRTVNGAITRVIGLRRLTS